MNRNEEFLNLGAELEQTPPTLEYAVTSARARAQKKRRRGRLFALPAGSLGALLLAFVLLVNLSLPFAMACAHIPVLAELAELVRFSPSLTAAVEHDYVQRLDLVQEENGVTMRIEYVIVDQKQLHIFYELSSSDDKPLELSGVHLSSPENELLHSYGLSFGFTDDEESTLKRITVAFLGHSFETPNEVLLHLDVYTTETNQNTASVWEEPTEDIYSESEPEQHDILASFTFLLQFDPNFTAQAEHIEVNQPLVIDGQTLTVSAIDIYPTHIHILFDENEANSAWLNTIDCYLENESGERFDSSINGFSASGNDDSPSMLNYYLESSYFSPSEQLTLTITGAQWLDKEMERVRIDMANARADTLPEGVTLEQAEYLNGAWQLRFSVEHDVMMSVFSTTYYDEAENEYSYNAYTVTDLSEEDSVNGFILRFALTGYEGDIVYLCPWFSHSTTLDEPISIPVR